MATITKAELRNYTLKKLGVLPSGQSASGEDAELVDDLIDAMFEKYDDIFPFASSAIPLWAREPLVEMAAAMASPYFGNAPITKTEDMALGDFVTQKNARIDPTQTPSGVRYY